MKHRAILISLVFLFAVVPAHAQHPYAGLQMRPIKALSNEQIADLRNGRGMGMALAAELNGYPGPIHVLELGQHLDLTQVQRARVQELADAMKAETIPIGERLISLEADLDRQFASGTITAANLEETVKAIGITQGLLRAAHLKYHLLTVPELTPSQIRRYAELRGYAEATEPRQHPRQH
jgi:hypothetical protein